jgi:hypothetical protein
MPSTTIQIRAEDKTKAAFRQINNRTQKLNKSFQGLSASLGGLKTALVGMVGVGVLGKFTKDILTLGDRLQKVSLQTGLAVEELEILQFAASQSGVATDAFNTALQKFSRNIGEAEQGTAAQKEAFESLGISITDSTGGLKDTSALFTEVAEAISGVEAPATKAATATDLFGRAGIELLPLLNTGAAGISGYAKTIRDANGIIGTDAANAFSKFNDKLDILQRSFRGKLAPVLTAILPALTMLAENLDTIAKFAGIAATAFIAAKIPVLLGAITAGVTALTVAIASNPIGAIAVGVTALGAAGFAYKDDIAEFFGFTDEVEKVQQTNTKLEKTAKIIKDVSKAEKIRTKTAESFAKTTKKDVVPNLKKLEKSLKDSNIQFKNIRGQEGLGGLQLAFVEFFGDVQTHALNYLSDASAIVSRHLKTIRQDFAEMITGLQNQLVFRRNDISDAFADILNAIENEMETKTWSADDLFTVLRANIAAADLFNITGMKNISASDHLSVSGTKSVKAADIFTVSGLIDIDLNNIENVTKQRVHKSMASIADYVNYYGVRQNYTPIGNASALKMGYSFGRTVNVSYDRAVPEDTENYDYKTIYSNYPVMTGPGVTRIPGIYGGGGGYAGRSSVRGSAADGSSALESTGGKTPIQVNIYDGTGQRISEYDSSIRVEINERASRFNEFSAMAA